uniref:Uncharacterized protein n=1 Tax=Arundo donax TaxID=35708 RepID=A0A0A8ZCH3_ARUDO
MATSRACTRFFLLLSFTLRPRVMPRAGESW